MTFSPDAEVEFENASKVKRGLRWGAQGAIRLPKWFKHQISNSKN